MSGSTIAAEDWEHALITGNGRQGALCYGSSAALRFTLAHERVFQPVTEPLPAPATAAALPRLREMLRDGRFAEAATEVCDLAAAEHPGFAETRWIDPLIGTATLTLIPDRPGRGWSRHTDFGTGVVRQQWDGGTCEAFFSRPADALLIRLTGGGGTLSLAPVAGLPERPVDFSVEGPGQHPAGGATEDPARHSAGPAAAGSGQHPVGGDLTLTARFRGADWAGALDGYTVTVRSWRTESGFVVAARTTPGLRPRPFTSMPDFEAALAAHAAEHGDLFGRARLDLPGDRRAQLLFDAGRYAIISSTGTRPPTLQGVWSGTWSPPWRSGWTIDGNLQAALLAVHTTGTPELMPPLFDLLDDLRDDLRENARRLYRLPGLYAPAHLGTHGKQNHFGPIWCLTFWTAGAAWLGRLYLEHYQHTGDRSFLDDRALPYLREVADFHLGFAEIDGGRARFSPSYSPENHPANTGSQATVDSALDVQTTGDVLRALLTHDPGDPRAPRWRALLDALPPHRITAAGELAEWLDPRFDDNHEHRHCSHLYPFYYAGDPAIEEDPALRAAAVATVRRRLRWWLSEASDEMGYGLALLGVAAARLGLAAEAYAALTRLAEAYWRPSLVPTHNRDHLFNVDLAGGFPALVAAMLLASRDVAPDGPARLRLLPALPAQWPAGGVHGLVARGPVRVDLRWQPGLVAATLTSPVTRDAVVTWPGGTVTVTLAAGVPHELRLPRQPGPERSR
ncbi:glycoside hydrolase N-terminal domain-containing protein [Actinoplanes oblitus]|uniref:Glycoside hydrolase N-terminal domain-containing protein n=1 Tax=Actinoplanes oblitus TaxID=3040509 RepID=A0ABY8WI68_9ACTN|nr:glycoside hydrolase N-terminal domain-containing protein [Actinoplanes oblitus]WIM97510.1 glycoside hydrolase N-terminal domain-containing protein [Actinoplanes oblitus]